MDKKKIFLKIYMNCKRGMLELDILLLNFFEKKYIKLKKKEKKSFKFLLEESDSEIYNLIIKKKQNKKYEKLISKIIKSYNQNRYN